MRVRLFIGVVFALASVALAYYAVWRQEGATIWSWGACLTLLVAAMGMLGSSRR